MLYHCTSPPVVAIHPALDTDTYMSLIEVGNLYVVAALTGPSSILLEVRSMAEAAWAAQLTSAVNQSFEELHNALRYSWPQ